MRGPSILILSSQFDLSTDLVVTKLREVGAHYLRLNSEQLPSLEICLEPESATLTVVAQGKRYVVQEDTLQSVWFRRATYPGCLNRRESNDARFSKVHFGVLLRNLMIFSNARWVNHPAATYVAEHKCVQLLRAKMVGLSIPKTQVTNAPSANVQSLGASVAVKGLDTVIGFEGDEELFGFTTIQSASELAADDWSTAPAIFQEELYPKRDIRATVVGKQVFSVEVLRGGAGVRGDWRVEKEDLEFRPHRLPDPIRDACIRFCKSLNLNFAAIDLALVDDRYVFLEVNPTGEWAWLVREASLPIDLEIAKLLAARPHENTRRVG